MSEEHWLMNAGWFEFRLLDMYSETPRRSIVGGLNVVEIIYEIYRRAPLARDEMVSLAGASPPVVATKICELITVVSL